MKLLVAFFKLIRWPNLFFIALTQCLFFFCVFERMMQVALNYQAHVLFYLLVTASVFISAAGYIINDYFDRSIDAVNKPQKLVIDRVIKRRWAIVWHWILSGAGILISLYVSYRIRSWVIGPANIVAVLLLWFYSTTFKKKLLSGNIIIAALTAWVLVVVYFFCGSHISFWHVNTVSTGARFFKFTVLYAGFAFIVSLIREVVKDMEDMDGDAKYGCKTMPIVWGVPTSKVFTAVWLVVCISALAIVQLYAWQLGYRVTCIYTAVLVILPLIYILRNLYKATTPAHYHQLSTNIKLVMLAGILSMLFFIF